MPPRLSWCARRGARSISAVQQDRTCIVRAEVSRLSLSQIPAAAHESSQTATIESLRSRIASVKVVARCGDVSAARLKRGAPSPCPAHRHLRLSKMLSPPVSVTPSAGRLTHPTMKQRRYAGPARDAFGAPTTPATLPAPRDCGPGSSSPTSSAAATISPCGAYETWLNTADTRCARGDEPAPKSPADRRTLVHHGQRAGGRHRRTRVCRGAIRLDDPIVISVWPLPPGRRGSPKPGDGQQYLEQKSATSPWPPLSVWGRRYPKPLSQCEIAESSPRRVAPTVARRWDLRAPKCRIAPA
jgi:hypothetical protein